MGKIQETTELWQAARDEAQMAARRRSALLAEADELAERIAGASDRTSPELLASWESRRQALKILASKAGESQAAAVQRAASLERRLNDLHGQARQLEREVNELTHRVSHPRGYYAEWERKLESELAQARAGRRQSENLLSELRAALAKLSAGTE